MQAKAVKKTMAERLALARIAAGYTQYEVGLHLGVRAHTVSRWERGETSPTIDLLRRLAELYGVSVGRLVE